MNMGAVRWLYRMFFWQAVERLFAPVSVYGSKSCLRASEYRIHDAPRISLRRLQTE
jgi:hypothetical protein